MISPLVLEKLRDSPLKLDNVLQVPEIMLCCKIIHLFGFTFNTIKNSNQSYNKNSLPEEFCQIYGVSNK